MKGKILIVDDEKSMRLTISMLLRRRGYVVDGAETFQEAIGKIEGEVYDLALTDLRLSDGSGLELLREAKRISPETEVIILTAFGSIESAVEAIRLGAFDYLTKPIDPDDLLLHVRKAVEHKRLRRAVRNLRSQVKERYKLGNIIGKSRSMQQIFEMITVVSRTDTTVLIQGESGTGKELVAKAIHTHSHRAEGPFVPVNCGAIPEALFESELFGHVKGAFTGASYNRKGLFEEADGGTIFLDEVGEIPFPMQVKLLRVLEEKRIRRIGSNETIPVDVRVIAATNKNLKALVDEGKFRDDLFYRLNVVMIEIPPLRERPDDILPLAEHFLERFSSKLKKDIREISPEARRMLLSYDWPGNVRELENAIERAVLLSHDQIIGPDDLPDTLRKDSGDILLDLIVEGLEEGYTLRELERRYIEAVLRRNRGNRSKTAEQLGIGRNTLWRKIKEYKIDVPEG